MIKCLGLLHAAVKKGQVQMVKALLEHGADANAIEYSLRDNGKRPLDVASNDEIKALLIEYGAMESERCAIQ